MKIRRDNNVLICSNKTRDLEKSLENLVNKDSQVVANFLVEKTSLPRELRTNALRLVLNEYVKIAKELVLSDEFMYRLNWYEKFSEYQLVNFWNVLATNNADKFNEKEEVLKYKRTFYLLLMLNADTVDFQDSELDELLKIKAPSGENESFQEFMSESDGAFYDYEGCFDGMTFEDFKTALKKSSTVADIRNIAAKYDIKVPKRLKKEELVAIVAEGLRRQGKYSEDTEAELKKMSAITLQRFAKMNGINASTEMKKADVVEYVMNNIESSSKAVRKPRVELVSLPELEEFQFSKDYLREVNVRDEEDDELPVEEPVVEAPVVEEPVVEEVAEEPAVEEVAEEPAVEEVQEEVVEEPVEEVAEEPAVEEVQEEVVEETVEEVVEAPVVDNAVTNELLQSILALLEKQNQRDASLDVLQDERVNYICKLYEERVSYLERLLEKVQTRSAVNPITVNVNYPGAPVQVVAEPTPVGDEETVILDEKPEEELEQAPETPVVEEPAVEEAPADPVEEPVTPVVHDSAFDSLSGEEKAAVVKAEMKDASTVVLPADNSKYTRKERRRLKKLAKKQAKLEKIREKLDKNAYKKIKRRKFRNFVLGFFGTILFIAVAILTVGALVDFNVIKGTAAEFINKYYDYVPFLGAGEIIRTTVYDWTLVVIGWVKVAIEWVKNFIASFQK